jgi:hypothetical protein
MFVINDDLSINITRGDAAVFGVNATIGEQEYLFKEGDVVRFKVFAKKNCEDVVLTKNTVVVNPTTMVEIVLSGKDTTIGEVINKPVDYWYEIELNPDTNPQTIIGYDEDGAKVFRLYPEGGVDNE